MSARRPPASLRDLMLKLDSYIEIIRSQQGQPPSALYVFSPQAALLREHCENWRLPFWRVSPGRGELEYRGIPVQEVRR